MFDPDILSSFSAEYAEARWEKKRVGVMTFQGSNLEEMTSQLSEGGAVRVLYKGAWGFVSFSRAEDLKKALLRARRLAAAQSGRQRRFSPPPPVRDKWWLLPQIDPFSISWEEKVALFSRYNEILGAPAKVTLSQVRYREMEWHKYFVNSSGSAIEQKKWDVSLSLSAMAAEGSDVQIAHYADGSPLGFDIALHLEDKAGEIASFAVDLLKAEPCPSGVMPVICDPEVSGLLAHEAFGHLSEADFSQENKSLQKLMAKGKRFGQSLLNIIDDGTLPFHQGSWKYDDEGALMRRTEMVKSGIFAHRLHNGETAPIFHEETTGNARAISHLYPPIIRMTNTFVEPQKATKKELFSGIQEGIYACGDRGGQTNCELFTFTPSYGYRIRKGRRGKLLKNVTLSGNVFDTLQQIDAIGKDFRMIGGLGGCGKEGQSPLPVTLGGPHIRIRKVLVGG